MLSTIKNCLFPTLNQYKKVDGYRDEAITKWIQTHPLINLNLLHPDQVEKLIKNVIQSLPTDQVTWDNLERIKDHLGKCAEQTECIKEILLCQIYRLSIDPNIKNELKNEIHLRNPPG